MQGYQRDFDIRFMDIQLPDRDGMTLSRKLRETNRTVILIFVTNMVQMAVEGYSVDAMDFIVKPVNYYRMAAALDNDGPQEFRHQALGEENEKIDTYSMTAFPCEALLACTWNVDLLQTVLRDEWGVTGTALTDYALHDFMYPDQMIRNGGTACLQSNRKNFLDQKNPSATTVACPKKATHEMCYMVANSNAMNGVAPGTEIRYSMAPWEMGCAVGITVAGLLFAAAIVGSVLHARDEKRRPDRYACGERFAKTQKNAPKRCSFDTESSHRIKERTGIP